MALINSTNEALAIMQIQRILRDLELLDNEYSSVPISGVYENETREAVSDFQGKYGIEQTGIVDYETWKLLHSIHESTRLERMGVRKVRLVPKNEEFFIFPRDRNDILYVIQYMLSQVSPNYDEFGSIEFTGVYDEPTELAIRAFQRKNLLDDTGVIDAMTLERLFDEYESIILEKS